jgi:hypothetical protein
MPLSVNVEAGTPCLGDRGAELVEHDRPGDTVMGADSQRVAGVVIEPAQDLDICAGREAVVGEVGLPGLVWLFGLEPHVGRARTLVGLGCDQTSSVQVAVDRRCRQRHAVVPREMPSDRFRAGVVAGSHQTSS